MKRIAGYGMIVLSTILFAVTLYPGMTKSRAGLLGVGLPVPSVLFVFGAFALGLYLVAWQEQE